MLHQFKQERISLRKIKKIISLVMIISLFLLSFLLIMNVENSVTVKNTNLIMETRATPIIIDGNYWLGQNASSGYGNSTHPYIIENHFIDGSGTNCIDIRNTDAHFIIENCTV